jgi:DNA-binding NarL/FixJ family response regulator
MSQIGLPQVPEIVLKESPQTTVQPEQMESSRGQLTPREMEILRLLAEGKVNKEVATLLGISVRTVETHRAKIMLKLGLHSLAELIYYALRHGIVSARGSA